MRGFHAHICRDTREHGTNRDSLSSKWYNEVNAPPGARWFTMYALRKSGIIIALAAVLLVLYAPVYAASVDSELGAKEVEMGKEAAAEIAKESKLSDNAADLKRVREIGQKIAAVANETEMPAMYGSPKVTPFEYQFNIIEEDDINAFSVPGGHIYVYRGLLNFVESDEELAGVLAHEIVHAAHHHMVYLLRKQAALNNTMAIALLAVMISGARSTDISNVALGVQLYQIAKLNGYGMQAERDSDHAAVGLMHKAGYNPVGLLTFMERLARRPELVDYGIYRSHPLDADRVKAAKQVINEMGLPINRRATTKAVKAVVQVDQVNGKDVPGVAIKDAVIYRPAPADGKSSEQRAKEAADRINAALDGNPQMYELRVDPQSGGVIVKGKAVLQVSDADAALMGKSPAQVATTAAAAIRDVVWKEMVDTIH